MRRLPRGVVPISQEEMERLRAIERRSGELGVEPLPEMDVPVDLRKRPIREYEVQRRGGVPDEGLGSEYWLRRIALAAEMIASTLVLRRGLFGRNVIIGTTPKRIVKAEFLRGYIFLNPASSIGLTTQVTVFPETTVTANGETNSTGVANFRDAHWFFKVSNIDAATTLTLIQQALDPVSGDWVDIQTLATFAGVTGVRYVNVQEEGVATDTRIRYTVAGGGPSATFSIGLILKDGLVGSSASGIAQTIYLGNAGVNPANGFPLLEGQSKAFYIDENVELFAVASINNLSLRIFEL